MNHQGLLLISELLNCSEQKQKCWEWAPEKHAGCVVSQHMEAPGPRSFSAPTGGSMMILPKPSLCTSETIGVLTGARVTSKHYQIPSPECMPGPVPLCLPPVLRVEPFFYLCFSPCTAGVDRSGALWLVWSIVAVLSVELFWLSTSSVSTQCYAHGLHQLQAVLKSKIIPPQ